MNDDRHIHIKSTGCLTRYFPLSIILVATLCLQIYYASTTSLWLDEFFSWAVIKRHPFQVIFLNKWLRANDWYMNSFPPLYEIFVHYFVKLFPHPTDLIYRIPSILCHLALIILVYQLTIRISNNRESPLLASFLIAFNPAYFFYGHTLRGYMFFSILTLISLIVLYNFITTTHIRHIVFLVLTQIAMLYTFYTSLVLVFLEDIFIIWVISCRKKRNLRIVGYLIILPWLLFIPWIKNFILACFHEASLPRTDYHFFKKTFLLLLHGFFDNNITSLLTHVSLLPFSLFYIYRKTQNYPFGMHAFICILLISILFTGASIYVAKDTQLSIRYLLPVLYFLFIINSTYICTLTRKIKIPLVVIIISCSIYTAMHGRYYSKQLNPEVKKMAHYVKSINLNGQKTMIFFEDAILIPGFLYYFAGENMAYLSTIRHFGKRDYINTLLKNQNIYLIGNFVGIDKYLFNKVVYKLKKGHYRFLIIIDSLYFWKPIINCSSRKIYLTNNFIETIRCILKKENLHYTCVSKGRFRWYNVIIYYFPQI